MKNITYTHIVILFVLSAVLTLVGALMKIQQMEYGSPILSAGMLVNIGAVVLVIIKVVIERKLLKSKESL